MYRLTMLMLMQRKPVHTTRCIQMKEAVPPLKSIKKEVPRPTSHVHMRIMLLSVSQAQRRPFDSTNLKPKILRNRKLRLISCILPMRYMSLTSESVPLFSAGNSCCCAGISVLDSATAIWLCDTISFSITSMPGNVCALDLSRE